MSGVIHPKHNPTENAVNLISKSSYKERDNIIMQKMKTNKILNPCHSYMLLLPSSISSDVYNIKNWLTFFFFSNLLEMIEKSTRNKDRKQSHWIEITSSCSKKRISLFRLYNNQKWFLNSLKSFQISNGVYIRSSLQNTGNCS